MSTLSTDTQRLARYVGFSVVELIVAMSVIAILLALVLPAVQQARHAARRAQCKNNLRQIGLALHSYEGVAGTFPIGYLDVLRTGAPLKDGGWSWAAYSLPYADQASVYNTIDFSYHPFGDGCDPLGRNSRAVAVTLAVFACPDDSKPQTRPVNPRKPNGTPALATSSYAGCMGAFDGKPCDDRRPTVRVPRRNNGMLVVNRARRLSEVTDGLSQVFSIGEVSWRPRVSVDNAAYGSDRNFELGVVTGLGGPDCTLRTPNSNGAFCHLRAARKRLNGDILKDEKHLAFHSYHIGGAHFLFADGSVHFISNGIEHTESNSGAAPVERRVNGPYGLYQRLSAINDGQPISEY